MRRPVPVAIGATALLVLLGLPFLLTRLGSSPRLHGFRGVCGGGLPDATHAATSDDGPVPETDSKVVSGARRFRVGPVHARLAAGNGGYEVVHDSPGVEVGVYVLVAPEPDRQQPHEDDEVYIVLEGRGALTVEGENFELTEGDSIFVPAGALHQFTGYENLSVLVFFAKRERGSRPSMVIDTRPP